MRRMFKWPKYVGEPSWEDPNNALMVEVVVEYDPICTEGVTVDMRPKFEPISVWSPTALVGVSKHVFVV